SLLLSTLVIRLIQPPLRSTLFPYTTLFRSPKLKFLFFGGKGGVGKTVMAGVTAMQMAQQGRRTILASTNPVHSLSGLLDQNVYGDRKSTRLNSSHVAISYAVFCLKKKKYTQ